MTKNALIAIQATLTATYAALSATEVVGDFRLISHAGNADAYIRAADASNVLVKAGEWFDFTRVSLQDIYMKGTVGNIISIIGNRTDQVRG